MSYSDSWPLHGNNNSGLVTYLHRAFCETEIAADIVVALLIGQCFRFCLLQVDTRLIGTNLQRKT